MREERDLLRPRVPGPLGASQPHSLPRRGRERPFLPDTHGQSLVGRRPGKDPGLLVQSGGSDPSEEGISHPRLEVGCGHQARPSVASRGEWARNRKGQAVGHGRVWARGSNPALSPDSVPLSTQHFTCVP